MKSAYQVIFGLVGLVQIGACDVARGLVGVEFVRTSDCSRPGTCGASGRLLLSTGLGVVVEAVGDGAGFTPALGDGLRRTRGFAFAETDEGLRLYVATHGGINGLIIYDGRNYGQPFEIVITVVGCDAMGDVAVLEGGDAVVSCFDTHRLIRIDPVRRAVVESFSCCDGVDAGFDPDAVTLAPDGTLLAGRSRIYRFDARTGAVLGIVLEGGAHGATTYDDFVFDAQGKLFVSANPNVGVLEVDESRPQVAEIVLPSGADGISDPMALAFDSNGRFFVGSDEGVIVEFNLATRETVREVFRTPTVGVPIRYMAFRP
ncbi:MAG: hypothetical protein HY763_09715 [Planctomycetes bacterium]|nr:hypothetical protein [Planctomycetota bacterium]